MKKAGQITGIRVNCKLFCLPSVHYKSFRCEINPTSFLLTKQISILSGRLVNKSTSINTSFTKNILQKFC